MSPPPFDSRREFRKTVGRSAIAKNPAREPSDPPEWPPEARELTRPGIGPEPRTHMPSLEQIGNAAASLHKVYLLFAAIAAAFAAMVIWINSRASKADLDEKVTTIASTQKSADNDRDEHIRQLSERVVKLETTINNWHESDEARWNGLDRILDRQFGQTTLQTPPPVYGPVARGKGKQ